MDHSQFPRSRCLRRIATHLGIVGFFIRFGQCLSSFGIWLPFGSISFGILLPIGAFPFCIVCFFFCFVAPVPRRWCWWRLLTHWGFIFTQWCHFCVTSSYLDYLLSMVRELHRFRMFTISFLSTLRDMHRLSTVCRSSRV